MKTAAYIFFLFYSINTFAQSKSKAPVDTTNNNIVIRCVASISKADTPLIIVDDKICTKGINSINPNDILSMGVLKGDSAAVLYGTHAVNGVVIITLKSFAAESYKKTFSRFSIKYKNYLKAHDYDDRYCFYFINGKDLIEKGTNDRVLKLYQISKKQITYVSATSNLYINGNVDNKEMVVIKTNN